MLKLTCLQDSTLGPLIFLLCVNVLQSVFSKSIVHFFTDDTNLLFPAKKLDTIESVINNQLKAHSKVCDNS